LGGGEVVVEVRHHVLEGAGAGAALLDELLDGGRAHPHERELRGDEEAVQHHEEQRDGELRGGDTEVRHQHHSPLSSFGRRRVIPLSTARTH